MTTVLTTVHGSRLYGTHHEHSDFDTYVVSTTARTRQRITGASDVTTVALEDFLHHVEIGVPQALEALWSPLAVVAPEWRSYLTSLYPNRAATLDRYDRTIANFMGWVPGGGRGRVKPADPKRRLHSLRMAINLAQYDLDGWFDPRLDPSRVLGLRALAEDHAATERALAHYGHVPRRTPPVS